MKISLQKVAQPIFRKMAQEAGIGERDLAEIACYNLISIYLQQHGQTTLTEDGSPDPGVSNLILRPNGNDR